MSNLLFVVFSLIALAALVAVIYPIPKIYLPTRKRALLVFLASSLISVGLQPPSEDRNGSRIARLESTAKKAPRQSTPTDTEKEEPAPATPAIVPSKITFEEVDKLFGHDSPLTDLQRDEAWKSYKNKCIQWTGTLVELDSGFLGIKIGMQHKSKLIPGMYDVHVSAPSSQKEHFLAWRKGQQYTYQGRIKEMPTLLSHLKIEWGCD